MGYCEVQDVIDKSGSTLDNTTLTNLVESGARKIRVRLKREGLGINPSPTPDELIEANAHFSAAMALYRAMVDGDLPASLTVDGAQATVNVPAVIAGHEAEGERYLQEYLAANIKSVSPYRIVGRRGERVGEYEIMSRCEEEEV